jgi:hypothetical protein
LRRRLRVTGRGVSDKKLRASATSTDWERTMAEFEKPPAGIIEANVAATPTCGGGNSVTHRTDLPICLLQN